MSGEACGHPSAALPVQGFHHRASSWKGVVSDMSGDLGRVGHSRDSKTRRDARQEHLM